MKRLIILGALVATAATVMAQSTVNINTFAGNAYLRFSNTVSSALASGPTAPNGDRYNVALYYGGSANSLSILAIGGANPASNAVFNASGYVNSASGGGTRTLSAVAPGVTTYFQLRAWTGNFSSYEECVAANNSRYLISQGTPVVTAAPANPNSQPPGTPTQIQWVPGATATTPMTIALVPVPEPSVIALGVLGLLGTLFIRRRK